MLLVYMLLLVYVLLLLLTGLQLSLPEPSFKH